jgi:AcrR family transcriptional regulator
MAHNRRPGRPRDRDLHDRRSREILQVATEVFARDGYADADVQVVADLASVGKGTVYRYFPTKEKLFLAAVDHGMRRLKAAVNAAVETARTPLDRLTLGIRAYLAFFDAHPGIVELLIQERAHFRDRKQATYFQHQEANLDPWQRLFRRLIREGTVRGVPVSRISSVISDLVYGTMFTNYLARRRKPLKEQCTDVLDILFHGLLAARR